MNMKHANGYCYPIALCVCVCVYFRSNAFFSSATFLNAIQKQICSVDTINEMHLQYSPCSWFVHKHQRISSLLLIFLIAIFFHCAPSRLSVFVLCIVIVCFLPLFYSNATQIYYYVFIFFSGFHAIHRIKHWFHTVLLYKIYLADNKFYVHLHRVVTPERKSPWASKQPLRMLLSYKKKGKRHTIYMYLKKKYKKKENLNAFVCAQTSAQGNRFWGDWIKNTINRPFFWWRKASDRLSENRPISTEKKNDIFCLALF